jgi:hypothetical protein
VFTDGNSLEGVIGSSESDDDEPLLSPRERKNHIFFENQVKTSSPEKRSVSWSPGDRSSMRNQPKHVPRSPCLRRDPTSPNRTSSLRSPFKYYNSPTNSRDHALSRKRSLPGASPLDRSPRRARSPLPVLSSPNRTSAAGPRSRFESPKPPLTCSPNEISPRRDITSPRQYSPSRNRPPGPPLKAAHSPNRSPMKNLSTDMDLQIGVPCTNSPKLKSRSPPLTHSSPKKALYLSPPGQHSSPKFTTGKRTTNRSSNQLSTRKDNTRPQVTMKQNHPQPREMVSLRTTALSEPIPSPRKLERVDRDLPYRKVLSNSPLKEPLSPPSPRNNKSPPKQTPPDSVLPLKYAPKQELIQSHARASPNLSDVLTPSRQRPKYPIPQKHPRSYSPNRMPCVPSVSPQKITMSDRKASPVLRPSLSGANSIKKTKSLPISPSRTPRKERSDDPAEDSPVPKKYIAPAFSKQPPLTQIKQEAPR